MSADLSRAIWRKSSRSNAERECVEVARVPAVVGIRDSKAPAAGHLALPPAAFATLLAQVKTGGLDL
ncbi:DUF397 domain-containing protein [Actinomadura parmotrematis]|uniref:DUF397 domain-containing protein n=1 Tax=Actinomadura parmotrematis TaxID=2864039 RepID=A0ABS7G0P5_9ACTN|nr:DUF397 domain-containing protein [Actinomadura parmotrematis]MBW8485965.1 DUF397 domain-containing protein [Actinomadura parmotrematis]